MKRFIKQYSPFSLVVCVLLILFSVIIVCAQCPVESASLGGLALLPFAFGAVKVRDDISKIRTVNYTHSSATVADTIYLLNGIPMLAVNSKDANVENVYVVEGLIEYSKVSAQAWTGGVKIYWDDTLGKFTTASSGNTLAGVAAEAAANPTSTGLVVLRPLTASSANLENAITDPGNGLAIPVTASGVCPIVTAGAETRTLAMPTILGQMLAICLKTDGGDAVITSAQAINQTGNNTITLNDAGDTLVLVAIYVGSALRWRVVVNDGASLSTV